MKNIKLIFLLLSMFSTIAFSATLTITTKYENSGLGPMNTTDDRINGIYICPNNNDYSNNEPGCDMSADVGYNDNNNDNDIENPDDDYYTGDLIVRTNDNFTVGVTWSWGEGASGEDQITLTGTLPSGSGFVWRTIPDICVSPESLISDDNKTITCLRKNINEYNSGSYSETTSFIVTVEGDATNGSVPGDIVFTASAPNATDVSDGVKDGRDSNLLKITATPRWNIKLYQSRIVPGYNNPNANTEGFAVAIGFTVGTDRVDGADNYPSTINPALGSEALMGGNDATISFSNVLTNFPPNAELMTWDNSNPPNTVPACSVDNVAPLSTSSSYGYPYPTIHTSHPERSILAYSGDRSISCNKTGNTVDFEIQHVDARLTYAPLYDTGGDLLPSERKIAVMGVLKIFVPNSDVEAGADGVSGTDDDNKSSFNTKFTNFDPNGISGTSNFGDNNESEIDNSKTIKLEREEIVPAIGSTFKKYFRRGWSDQPDQQSEWGGINNYSYVFGIYNWFDASFGRGITMPGGMFGTHLSLHNISNVEANISNPTVCDVIDTNTYEIVKLRDTDDLNTHLDDSQHAVDIESSGTYNLDGIKVEYATGYVASSWPPESNVSASDIIKEECNSSTVEWYDTFTEASLHGAVSKVRMSANSIAKGQRIYARIKHRARTEYFDNGYTTHTSGTIPANTLLINYATSKDSTSDNLYRDSNYKPMTYDTRHFNYGQGDRLTLKYARTGIDKSMTPESLIYNGGNADVNVTLTPTYMHDANGSFTGHVVITDVLPKGLRYKANSTTQSPISAITYGEPTLYDVTEANCNDYAQNIPCSPGLSSQILVWDLGNIETGTNLGQLFFTTEVTLDANMDTLTNHVQIVGEGDESDTGRNKADATIHIIYPNALLIKKDVLTPSQATNSGSLENWMTFKVSIKNAGGDELTDLDIIDLLPFNGDGSDGFKMTPQTGTTINIVRDPATHYSGSFEFDSVSFDGNNDYNGSRGCTVDTIEYWYTAENPTGGAFDISPKATQNTDGSGNPTSIWCQGDENGPDTSCGFTKSEVTALRLRKSNMDPSGVCYLNVTFATNNNRNGDTYANTASATVFGLHGIMSNTPFAEVYADANATLGDYVWSDDNGNGIQDDNEAGIGGVTVNLYVLGNHTVYRTTTTNSDGIYRFEQLEAGKYSIEVVPPSGYAVTNKNQGADDARDSDINPDTGRSDNITLLAGASVVDIDIGMVSTAEPAIALIKKGTLNDGGDGVQVGDTIHYTFNVTNIGNVALTDAVINDTRIGVSNQSVGDLAVGESKVITMEYTMTQSDINDGHVTNQAIVIAKDPRGKEVTDKSDDNSNFEDDPTVTTFEIPTPTPTPTPTPCNETSACCSTSASDTTVTQTPVKTKCVINANNDLDIKITSIKGTVIKILANDGCVEECGKLTFTQAAKGTVSINGGGTPNDLKDDVLIYTPEANLWDAKDTFQYTITDCKGNSSTATVTLNINCTSSQTSDGDALSKTGIIMMMLLTMMISLLYIRREESTNKGN